MYEPKYKLNKKDAARWHILLTRHCLDCPAKPGHKRRFIRKYPPLTPEENAEFETLCQKRSAKLMQHPKIRESLRHQRRHNQKLQRLITKLERLLAPVRKKLKIDVDQH